MIGDRPATWSAPDLDAEPLALSLAANVDLRDAFDDFSRRRRGQVRFYSQLLMLLARTLESPPPGVAWARDPSLPYLGR